jgi:hypothetical protein
MVKQLGTEGILGGRGRVRLFLGVPVGSYLCACVHFEIQERMVAKMQDAHGLELLEVFRPNAPRDGSARQRLKEYLGTDFIQVPSNGMTRVLLLLMQKVGGIVNTGCVCAIGDCLFHALMAELCVMKKLPNKWEGVRKSTWSLDQVQQFVAAGYMTWGKKLWWSEGARVWLWRP